MKRNKELIIKRKKFIRSAIDNPKVAAENLRMLATGLENCRNTKDIIFAVQEILYVSECTIYKDFIYL